MSEVMSEDSQLRAELDELGEEKVRDRLVHNVYGPRKRPIVVDWLAQRAENRQADAQGRQESRENEALVLARQAGKRATIANWIACFAAAIAVVAIIVSVVM
jgi:t-SNARE complex subunit (syntaxin)